MKNKKIKPTRSRFNVLRQICNFIPEHEVSKIARETGAADKSRTFSPWSHTVSLLDAQLTHCIGLNDLCDSLQLHSGPLSTLRGATAPSRNGLSHANRERPAQMAEQLFWRVLEHLKEQDARLWRRASAADPAFRFKMPIHVIDSTTMELVANCLDWANGHRRREGRRQDSYALEPAESVARFLHRPGHRRRARQQAGARTVRRLAPAAKSPCLTRVMWISAICGI